MAKARPSIWGGPERRPWSQKDIVTLIIGLALGVLAGLALAQFFRF